MSKIVVKYFDIREISENDINEFLIKLKSNNNISKDRIIKSLSFIPLKTRQQSILANVMIDEELKEKAKDIYYNDKNKPLLNDNLFFSISHSEDLVVFVKDNSSIGIDIEYIDTKHNIILDYAFTNEEKEYINNNFKDNIEEGIIKLWTIKESVYKASGNTLDILPKDISINVMDFSNVVFLGDKYYIITKKIDNYYLSIASIIKYEDIILLNEFSKELKYGK